MVEQKKNRKILFIVLLSLLVVLTSIFIGTLARYLTSGTITDGAEVAKFGLNVPTSIDLFSDSYTNVKADTSGKKIVAPGTAGEYTFNVSGTSEVAYKVSAKVSTTYSSDWNGYEPLEFSLDNLTWTNISDFETNLSAALGNKTLQPNEEYSSTQKIYWKWPFQVSTENDIKDTALGVKAAAGTALEATVKIEVTAAQVD